MLSGSSPCDALLSALADGRERLAYELAEELGLDPQAVELHLWLLQGSGSVLRAPGPDGRWRWRATPAAREVLAP